MQQTDNANHPDNGIFRLKHGAGPIIHWGSLSLAGTGKLVEVSRVGENPVKILQKTVD